MDEVFNLENAVKEEIETKEAPDNLVCWLTRVSA